MAWHSLADVADLVDNDVIGREIAGRKVAIFQIDGTYHATAGLCTHANAMLCQGEIVDGFIECPAHFGYFEIATGKAQGAPVTVDLKTYPLRVTGTHIEIDIEE